jgi:hypothetical protein
LDLRHAEIKGDLESLVVGDVATMLSELGFADDDISARYMAKKGVWDA